MLADDKNIGRSLFLHSCCAPCSSYVLTYLSSFFDITVFYFNPNITSDAEYTHRVLEQKRLIQNLNEERFKYPWACNELPHREIKVIDLDHETQRFYDIAKGFEEEKEGGARCVRCFRLRLEETAKYAVLNKADYFGTTLTISPLKNAQVINNIGYQIEKEVYIKWLPSDFKKKEGYKHSIELSAKFDLYRQNFCGCEYSHQTPETM